MKISFSLLVLHVSSSILMERIQVLTQRNTSKQRIMSDVCLFFRRVYLFLQNTLMFAREYMPFSVMFRSSFRELCSFLSVTLLHSYYCAWCHVDWQLIRLVVSSRSIIFFVSFTPLVTRLWTKETSDRLQRITRSAERHSHVGRAFLTSDEDINGDKASPLPPLINLLDHRQHKRASRMASQPVLRQEFVDATNFQRNTVYSSLDLLPHNLSVVLIRWYPQPSIRVFWVFNDKVPCEAFQILYHPIASRYEPFLIV